VINKIDLPSAHPDEVAVDIGNLLGIPAGRPSISAKAGTNIDRSSKPWSHRSPLPKAIHRRLCVR
jgi:GTP-binding protein LepA